MIKNQCAKNKHQYGGKKNDIHKFLNLLCQKVVVLD